jgi:hypothetical protein
VKLIYRYSEKIYLLDLNISVVLVIAVVVIVGVSVGVVVGHSRTPGTWMGLSTHQ